MRTDTGQTVFLKDYAPTPYRAPHTSLMFALHPTRTVVRATTLFEPVGDGPLELVGDGLELVAAEVDGEALEEGAYEVTPDKFVLKTPPEWPFSLTLVTIVSPDDNTELMGLYRSNGVYCTQCEAEGYRRITYAYDRPDVLTIYDVFIVADGEGGGEPVLLSNGNLVASGDSDGRRTAHWQDPFPKPTYLFALVAGDLGAVTDTFTTMSGRKVTLNIYVERGKEPRATYAMDALKRSMAWDETRFGREYDLDVFNIVAVSDFNMGAMENKGLNVFNDRYVLADPAVATDQDYCRHRDGDRARVLPQLDRQPHHLPRLVPAVSEGRAHRLPRPGVHLRRTRARGEADRRRAAPARGPVPRGRLAAAPLRAPVEVRRDLEPLYGDRLRQGRRADPHDPHHDRRGELPRRNGRPISPGSTARPPRSRTSSAVSRSPTRTRSCAGTRSRARRP